MDEKVATAVVSGFFSIIGEIGIALIVAATTAVITTLVTKYGAAFWRPPKVYQLRGNATETKTIGADGKVLDQAAGYTYELTDSILSVRGDTARLTSQIRVTEGTTIVAEGKMRGDGTCSDGMVFLVYTISDPSRSQSWSGVSLLRVSGFGDMNGFWMTDDIATPGVIAFGTYRMTRR